jgi:gliding motility-associated-like protein
VIKSLYIFILFVASCNTLLAQDFLVDFVKTERECVLGEASVTIVNGVAPIQILWSNGSILSSVDQLQEGIYSVQVSDANNHDTIINFTIGPVYCAPIAQNNFTPNGDAFNDTWSISRLEYFPNFELFVYNRWGQLVHHQANDYIPWDGRSLTLPIPDASYYYILYLDKSDKKKFIKGDVSIVR